MSDTTIATLPAPPPWALTTRPIEQGREFSTGFGDPVLVEIVQSEIMDDATEPASILRTQPRLYLGGESYSPGEARTLVELLRTALGALDVVKPA